MMKQRRRMMLDNGAQEAVENYMSSLAELTVNSKPHINALTFLAEDYLNYAEAIVNAVDDHLKKVSSNIKLPILYLIDSIIKNVQKDYIPLFSRTIVQSFCTVFEQVDEKTRQQMYKLRQTWNDIISQEYLYAMDVQVRSLDPKWPITAAPPGHTIIAPVVGQQVTSTTAAPHKIHINPKFINIASATGPAAAVAAAIGGKVGPAIAPNDSSTAILATSAVLPSKVTMGTEEALREQLLQKKRNLLQLEQERVDLELSQMKAKLDKKQRAVSKLNEKTVVESPQVGTTKEKPTHCDSPDPVPVESEATLEMVKGVRSSSQEGERKAFKLEQRKKDSPSPIDPAPTPVPPSAPRIAPASSALVNLVTSQRAQRDPRISKQVKEESAAEDSSKSHSRSRDPRLNSKSEKGTRSSEKDSSKSSRRSRDVSSDRSSRHSSRREEREKRSSESRSSSRKSEDRTSSRSKKTSSRSPSKSSTKRDRRKGSSRSPRKTSYKGHRPVSDCADSTESDASDSKDRGKSPSSPRTGTTSGSSDWAVNYTKGSHKGRNYVRRNCKEESPEAVSSTVSSDVDLRLGAPPEKQLRLSSPTERLLQSSSSSLSPGVAEQILPPIACQDVDLRGLPPSPGKKRQSAEPEDGPPPPKKNKAAYIEMLFGKQDVDLRQKDINNGMTVDAPSPPPPPIISSSDGQTVLKDSAPGWSKFKQTLTPSPTVERSPAFPRSSRYDRLGCSSVDGESNNEDTDMRLPMNGFGSSSKPDYEGILKTARDQYNNGTISLADYSKVQKEVFRRHEQEKINEVQRNDFSRRTTWERRLPREKDYKHGMGSPENSQFGDIDERYPTSHPVARPSKKPLLPLPPVPPMCAEGNRPPSRYMGHRMPGPMQGGYMRPHRPLLGSGPRGMPRGAPWRRMAPGPAHPDNTISLPPADGFILKMIAQDPTKKITIDGIERQIRFYGENAVAFLASDDPREIAFDPGEASVIIDGEVVHCSFHKPAKEVNVSGKTYKVHLGAPTRELYINDEGFECQFNCPPREIQLSTGETLLVQLKSDVPPMVNVGNQRRDLVAGRVTLVIDANITIPIFLDAKPQRFDIDGVPHIIKFADALETILVNNHPFNIQFDGPPVPLTVNDALHYIRLSKLPPDVVPGEVEIVSMSKTRPLTVSAPRSGGGTPWTGLNRGKQPLRTTSDTDEASHMELEHDPALSMHEPALPVRGGLGVLNRGAPKKILKGRTRPVKDSAEPSRLPKLEERQMPPELLQAIQPGLPSLLGLIPGSNTTGYSSAPSTSSTYGVRQTLGSSGLSTNSTSVTPSTLASTSGTSGESATSSTSAGSSGVPFLAPEVNVTNLIQSLYDFGLLSTVSLSNDSNKNKTKENEDLKKKVHIVDFKDAPSLRVKQPSIIDTLYSGIQCSSCGTRFPPEQTEKYSAHLDWHFRQNRREKDSAKKPMSRKWYYDFEDWIKYEEIDDTLDKAQNWFDIQQSETAKFEETVEEEIQSIPSSEFPEGTVCQLCHDKFENFFNEEKEEWHLRNCLVDNGLPYHPVCYKDIRVSVDTNDGEPSEASSNIEESGKSPSDEQDILEEKVKKEPEEEGSEEKIVKEEEVAEGVAEDKKEMEGKGDANSDPSGEEISAELTVKQEVMEEAADASIETGAEEVENAKDLKTEPVLKEEKDDSNEGVAVAAAEDVPTELKEEPKEELPETKTLQDVLLHEPITDTTSAVVSCSIDGNLELAQAPTSLPSGPKRIKINISKPIVVKKTEDTEDESDGAVENCEADEPSSSSEPMPPGEEPIVLKPKLIGRKLTALPAKSRGTETSGLCSIM